MKWKNKIKVKTMADFAHKYLITPNGCWEWQYSRNRKGYGTQIMGSRVNKTRTTKLAHRVFYELKNGPFDQKLNVLHKCDNPPCVNPEHLTIGTQKDNMADCLAKGRHKSFKGTNNSRSKLTDAQVLEIREKLGAGIFQSIIAEEYGVNQTLISAINTRKNWTHV